MINAIDYLAEMGFTQVWTMPLLQNNMERYSYHEFIPRQIIIKLTRV